MKKIIAICLVLCTLILALGSGFVLPVSAATMGWAGDCTLKNAAVQGEAVQLSSVSAYVSSSVTMDTTAIGGRVTDNGFDVEFQVRMNSFTGNEKIQIFTGGYRVNFTPKENAISYETASGGWTDIPYGVGNGTHTYRAVGAGGQAALFVDNVYLTTFNLPTDTTETKIVISVKGSSAVTGNVTVSDMTVYNTGSGVISGYSPAAETGSFSLDFSGSKNGIAWDWKDGYIYSVDEDPDVKSFIKGINLGYGRDFTFTTNVRFPRFGQRAGIQLFWPYREIKLNIRESNIVVNNSSAPIGEYVSDTIRLGDNNWHQIGITTRHGGTLATVSLDGNPILDCPTELTRYWNKTTEKYEFRNSGHLYYYIEGGAGSDNVAEMHVKNINCQTTDYGAEILLPFDGAIYRQGDKVSLSAKACVSTSQLPSLEYKINGKTVATGQAPNYQAEITGLPAGTYEITAGYGSYLASAKTFTILPDTQGEISARQKANGTWQISLDGNSRFAKVSYFLDGGLIAETTDAPYLIDGVAMDMQGHMLTAVCQDGDGVTLAKFHQEIIPDVAEAASMHYANEVSYTIDGTKGTAEVKFQNGNHQIWLQHTPDKVVYHTDEGIASVDVGTGKFYIITDGPVAEVYKDGKLAFTYYMPRTDAVKNCFYENGMQITDYSYQITPERQNYFVKRNVKDQQKVYGLSNLPFYHNLDFVAGADDEARLVVSDGYYQADIELKEGKFYIWNIDKDRSDPYRMEICDALADDAYYRVETALGLCRIYGNGRWLGTFRAIHSEGAKSVAVDVTKGELPYVAVSDNKDLYIYQEDFTGATASSIDYLRLKGTTPEVKSGTGNLYFNVGTSSDNIAELIAFVEDGELSADVTMQYCANGGFWLMSGHTVSNVYAKVGYNFSTEKYEVVERKNSYYTTYETTGPKLAAGEKKRLTLKVKGIDSGKIVTLYVDGEKVLEREIAMEQHGKMGFVIQKGQFYLDNISFRGDAMPVVDVSDTINVVGDFIESGDTATVVNGYYRQSTTDGGKTWSAQTSAVSGDSTIVTKLNSGKYISIIRSTPNAADAGFYEAYVSTDGCNSWVKQGTVMAEALAGRTTMPNRVTQGKSGRIYFPSCENNNEDYGHTVVYYSDNEGVTWQKSETEMNARNEGYGIQEVVVIEFSDTLTRAYFRNDMGFIHYFDSADRGKTWDLTPKRTPFYSALNCFGVELDPYDKSTVYVAYSNDNSNLGARNQYPRTRWSVARSKDYGETWENLGTVHENDNLQSGFAMMNLGIHVTKNYVFLEATSDDVLSTASGTARTIGFAKNKQVGTKRFEQVHYINQEQAENTSLIDDGKLKQTILANPSSGDAVVQGELVKGAVTSDNRIALSAVAEAMGAKMTKQGDGSVTFTQGGSAVTFAASEVTQVNGNPFVLIETVLERYGLKLKTKEGAHIISPYDWGENQLMALINNIKPFSDAK